jgi:hypothetical protein
LYGTLSSLAHRVYHKPGLLRSVFVARAEYEPTDTTSDGVPPEN